MAGERIRAVDRDTQPPSLWEALLRRILPRGTVGLSILGDLREEYARKKALNERNAARWYRKEAVSTAVHALRDRLAGRWSADPRFGPRSESSGKGDPMGAKLFRSMRYAVRSLSRAPRFTIIAVFTLALGIGANTAIFSVVNGVLLQPLDYPDSDALVNVRSTAPGMGYNRFPLSASLYFSLREGSTAFADLAFYRAAPASLTGEGEPESVRAVSASHTLFSTLGVGARLGRTFTAEEDQPDAPRVVVIGHGLWQRRFGGDRSVLGRPLVINGEAHQIVGVMPRRFDYPGNIELWIPARFDAVSAPWSFSYPTIGRLAEGVTEARAQANLEPIVDGIIQGYPEGSDWRNFMEGGEYAAVVGNMKEELVGSLRQPLWILLGTVGFVLLIACTNVANLVLIRGEGRRRESAVRAALGASRAALVGQSLMESTLLATVGGGLGLLVAWLGVPIVLSQAPPQLPRLGEVGVDGAVLLFTLGATGVSILLFGAAPLLRFSPTALFPALKLGGPRSTGGFGRQRSRSLLVAGQTALALVLMVGSGLLVRSFAQVYRTDLGFQYDDLLTFRLSLPESRYPTPSRITAFHEEVLEKLQALPGVESAGLTSAMPVADPTGASPFVVGDAAVGEEGERHMLDFKYVTAGYAEALQIPLQAGRTFTPLDAHDGVGSAMVDRTFADRFWPGQNPVGKRFRASHETEWYTVVGVVGSVLEDGVRRDRKPMVLFPLMSPGGDEGWEVRSATYVIQSRNPAALTRAAQSAVWGVDPDIPLAGIRAGEDIVADSVVQLSFTMVTLGMAAALALILGTVGLFGVLSYSVAQRRREIAVHMALGAEQGEVMKMIVGHGARITGAGIVVGLGGAWALSRLLQGILFGVGVVDPMTYGGMAAMLLAVALIAAYLPARRAAAVNPVESMQAE